MTTKKGKGNNPNSHRNKPKLGEGAIAKGVTLAPDEWGTAYKVGGGNYSLGLRRAINLAAKSKIAIEMLLEKMPNAEEYAESLLVELENLEIEQVHQRSVSDDDIRGAWIV